MVGVEVLPRDLALKVLQLLPSDSRARCSAVCQKQRQLLQDLAPEVYAQLQLASVTVNALSFRAAALLAKGTLVEIDVRGCSRLASMTVADVASMNPALRKLYASSISDNWSPTKVLGVLEHCQEMEEMEIDLSSCLYDATLPKIMRLPTVVIRSIRSGGIHANPEGESDQASAAQYLIKQLNEYRSGGGLLECVDLSRCGFGDRGTQVISTALAPNSAVGAVSSVTNLDLSFNALHIGGAEALSTVLDAPGSCLVRLSLKCNTISVQGADILASCLHQNHSLRELCIGCNSIGDEGATSFAEALHHNTALQTLDLVGNDITEAGAEALGYALQNNTTLQKLDLSSNLLKDAGTWFISDMLWANMSLKELHIQRNDIEDKGAKEFFEALGSDNANCAITNLDLRSNRISKAVCDELSTDLRINLKWQKYPLRKATG